MSQAYKLIQDIKADGDISIKEHRNEVTGIRLFTATLDCPIVRGNFVFATEAHDDDGLPHTLEHLVFLGSEDYPYKGVLDQIANRCLADGSNASTDTDNTSYTYSTAGPDGFLNLLPIYLEHLLFPTLTDEGYLTEVHHINGEGEDAGVVYCEMQGSENSGNQRCYLEMSRSLYPQHGYKSETGGLLENLRTSTSNLKVREYHKKFYHPKNLAIVIVGPIEPEQVIKAIKPVEDKIVRRSIHEVPFQRPWQTPVAPLETSIVRSIEYPCDEDDDGIVNVGFLGPKVEEGYAQLVALSTLLEYLDSTAISPIQQAFVENSEPYCSSVSHNILEYSTSCFYFSFESVGQEYLDKCLHKLISLFNEHTVDMSKMATIISRRILNILSATETSPHSFVLNSVISHFLYGQDDLQERCQEILYLRQLASKDLKFWQDLLKQYTDRYVCIVGRPSRKLMQTMSAAEKKRITDQRTKLKNELPQMASRLKDAIAMNERPAPLEMIQQVPVPSTKNIKFHNIERVVVDNCLNYRLHYDSIKTNFITIQMLFNSSDVLTHEDRLFLPLLSESILESAISDHGTELSYEDFVAKLFAETVSYGTSLGLSSGSSFSAGPASMLFNIGLQVEVAKYQTAVDLYRQILYHSKFTAERLTTIATRMHSDISQYKRSGGKVTSAALTGITYKPNSNQWGSNFLRQQVFLKQTLETLKEKPDLIIDRLTKIRDYLREPQNVMVHITLDKNKVDVDSCHVHWDNLHAKSKTNSNKLNISSIKPCKSLISPITETQAIILGVGSVESNFMHLTVKSIDDPLHDDLPALNVLIQYLTQLEGPLWRRIRGLGLTYSYSIQISSSEGLLHFLLYKSTQLVEAYEETIKIVNEHLESENKFEDSLFESAKSSLIFDFVSREKSAAGRSMQSLVAYIRNLDIDYNRQLINRLDGVTKQDLLRVGREYLKDIFESQSRRVVVCCNTSKVAQVSEGLERFGLKLKSISLEGNSMLNAVVA